MDQFRLFMKSGVQERREQKSEKKRHKKGREGLREGMRYGKMGRDFCVGEV